MAITHSNFLTQVRNYTEVDSNVFTDALLDEFIRNVELNIASKVDYDDLRKYATTSTIASQRYLSMPSDLIYLRSVQVTNSGVRDFLEKRDTSFISEFNPSETTGVPKYYANWDDQNIVLAPTPNSAYTIQINYIIDPPHFTSTNSTFLSTYQDQLLLYGVLAECFSYLKGPMDMYKVYLDKYNESTEGFMSQQMGNRRRGQYEDGVLRVPLKSTSP
jgi:hypothetical protein